MRACVRALCILIANYDGDDDDYKMAMAMARCFLAMLFVSGERKLAYTYTERKHNSVITIYCWKLKHGR